MADPSQLLTHPLGRQNEIHAAGRHRASRHAVVFRGSLVLGKGDSAFIFDAFQSQRAIAGRAGENHSDGAAALIGCELVEK